MAAADHGGDVLVNGKAVVAVVAGGDVFEEQPAAVAVDVEAVVGEVFRGQVADGEVAAVGEGDAGGAAGDLQTESGRGAARLAADVQPVGGADGFAGPQAFRLGAARQGRPGTVDQIGRQGAPFDLAGLEEQAVAPVLPCVFGNGHQAADDGAVAFDGDRLRRRAVDRKRDALIERLAGREPERVAWTELAGRGGDRLLGGRGRQPVLAVLAILAVDMDGLGRQRQHREKNNGKKKFLHGGNGGFAG